MVFRIYSTANSYHRLRIIVTPIDNDQISTCYKSNKLKIVILSGNNRDKDSKKGENEMLDVLSLDQPKYIDQSGKRLLISAL